MEITPDPRYLLPDPIDTLRAAEVLVAEGFTVLPYCSADPVLCKRLEEAGCATVMPLGSWIGSNQGLRTRAALEIIIEQAMVPVVVDAGIGAPSHAAEAHGARAPTRCWSTPPSAPPRDPAAMGRAFALAVEAGRAGVPGRAGRARPVAAASSPLTGFLPMTAVPTADPVGDTGADTGAGPDAADSRPVAVLLDSRPDVVPPGTAAADVVATDIGALRAVDRAADATSTARVGRDRGRRRRRAGSRIWPCSSRPPRAGRLEDLAQLAQADPASVRADDPPVRARCTCPTSAFPCARTADSRLETTSVAAPSRSRGGQAEAAMLRQQGFRHVLLVAGEHARIISKDYLVECVRALAPTVPQLGVEVQVWDADTYRRLVDGRLRRARRCSRRPTTWPPSRQVHRKGKKRNYDWRLAAPDRGAEAGMRRLGIGALLGPP